MLSAIALYLALPKVDSDQATLSDKVFMITYALVSLMIGLSVLKDWRWIGRRPAVHGLVAFAQGVVYPLVAVGMMTYLVAGPQTVGETARRLIAAITDAVSGGTS